MNGSRHVVSVAMGILLHGVSAGAQEVSFYTSKDYFNSALTGFVVADFDRNAKPDVAFTWNSVATFALNGAGTVTVPTGAFASSDPVAADFNGNGTIDLAITDGGGWVSVLLNDGAGSFLAPIGSVAGDDPFRPMAGDFTSDGIPDLAVIHGGRGVSVLRGNGDGTFALPMVAAVGLPASQLAAADYNRDGRLDLAVAMVRSIGLSTLVLLRGKGDGTFEESSLALDYEANQLVTADFNADGNPDLAMVRRSQLLVVMTGNGDGTFQPGVQYGSGHDSRGALVVGDLNGDGRPDVILCDSPRVFVLLNNGAGRFPTEKEIPIPAAHVAIADFNADARADLAIRIGGLGSAAPALGCGGAGATGPS